MDIYTKNGGPSIGLLDASQMSLNLKRSTGTLNLPAEIKSLNSNTQLNEPKKEEEIVEKEK